MTYAANGSLEPILLKNNVLLLQKVRLKTKFECLSYKALHNCCGAGRIRSGCLVGFGGLLLEQQPRLQEALLSPLYEFTSDLCNKVYLDETGCNGADLNTGQEAIFVLGGVSVKNQG